mgnify:CR=1 FL=1
MNKMAKAKSNGITITYSQKDAVALTKLVGNTSLLELVQTHGLTMTEAKRIHKMYDVFSKIIDPIKNDRD